MLNQRIKIPIPITRRSNGDCQSGSSPGSSSSLARAFPGDMPQWRSWEYDLYFHAGSLTVTVAGPLLLH